MKNNGNITNLSSSNIIKDPVVNLQIHLKFKRQIIQLHSLFVKVFVIDIKQSDKEGKMSIVIKSNELNTLVYKYLLEAGLSHTAYTMFNEARLQSPLEQFKYDIKNGHLLSLLQKGLILSQIQSHVNFGVHQQCMQPFSLLKPHTCLITESKKQSQAQFLTQLNQNITECIKRTNAVYNTELSNKNFEEIVYDPRGVNYFDKFEKFKFTDIETSEQNGYPFNQQQIKESLTPVRVEGQKDRQIAIWNKHQNIIYLANKNPLDDTVISKLYPCTLNSQLKPLQYFRLTLTHLVMVFGGNRVKIITRETDSNVEFTLSMNDTFLAVDVNENMPNLLIFQSKSEYFIMNAINMQEIMSGVGVATWRGFDEYVIFKDSTLCLKSLVKQQPIITYQPLDTGYQKLPKVSHIAVSPNMTFFFTLSDDMTKIWVHTFEKDQCLYMFDFTDNEESLKQVIWTHRNQVDYLCILTDTMIRVWEVELNSYCLKVDLAKYDIKDVQAIASLEKNDTESFLLALGSSNLLVSDIANQKIQRVESPSNCTQMKNVGRNSVYVATDQHVYFLDGQKLSDLFK